MNKKYCLVLTILLISVIIISILIPSFNNIFNNKIIEGASTSTPVSEETIQKEITTNLKAINQDKISIQELIQQKNESVTTPSDITTSTARLDYTTLENKSLNIQVIILSIILLIIVIGIIAILMS